VPAPKPHAFPEMKQTVCKNLAMLGEMEGVFSHGMCVYGRKWWLW